MADVRAGVERGEDPDAPDKMGWTPLHFAAQSQTPEVASILLHARATVDARDSYGKTPLAVALFNVKEGRAMSCGSYWRPGLRLMPRTTPASALSRRLPTGGPTTT